MSALLHQAGSKTNLRSPKACRRRCRVFAVFRLFKESIFFALNALLVNRLRTFLSLLGITIGIFTIISVFTIVDALEKNLRSSIASLGDNVIYIQKWPWAVSDPSYPWWKFMKRPVPHVEELEVIQHQCQNAEVSAFVANSHKTITFQNNSIENVEIFGASRDYDKVKRFELGRGRYISETEFISGRNVAIIGDAIANALFQDEDPVGKDIKIKGRKVTVIGVFKKEGESILGGNVDTGVLIPVNYAVNLFDVKGEWANPNIMVKAKPSITNDQLMDELVSIMRSIRKLKPLADDDFALNQTSVISKQFDPLFDFVGAAGWIIGGFSILVGGFGIANIMFVSVKERTAIIGIQKSLGAKNYFILLQFLSESIILSLLGGIVGLLIISIGTFAVGDFFNMEITLTKSNIILGLTISVLIGIISGFVPSYSASQLDPVEAIRAN